MARKAAAQAAVANVMNTQGDTSGEDIEGGGAFECEPDEDNATSDSEEEEEERAISVADEDEDEDEDESIQGVAYNRQWKDERCALAGKLVDPASDKEKLTWDSDLLSACDRADNLEDHTGYYDALGCLKTSSDREITEGYKRTRKIFHTMALQYHPNKTTNRELIDKYHRRSSKWELAEKAFAILGKANNDGHFKLRVCYDLDGERQRDLMEEVSFCFVFNKTFSNCC